MLLFIFYSVSLLQPLRVYCGAVSEDIGAFVNEIELSLERAEINTNIKFYICEENNKKCLILFKVKSNYDREQLISKTREITRLNYKRMSSYINLFSKINMSILTFKKQLDPQVEAYNIGLLKRRLSNVKNNIQSTIQELLEQQTAYHTIYLRTMNKSITPNFSDECVDAYLESTIKNSQNEIDQIEKKEALFDAKQISLFDTLNELSLFDTLNELLYLETEL